MAGGSLESILRSTHEVWNTREIRDGVGENGVKRAYGVCLPFILLHLLKILAVFTTCRVPCVSRAFSSALKACSILLVLVAYVPLINYKL